MIRPPPRSPLFPYPPLSRPHHPSPRRPHGPAALPERGGAPPGALEVRVPPGAPGALRHHAPPRGPRPLVRGRPLLSLPLGEDRKSTRLNSSHLVISYAVFCL